MLSLSLKYFSRWPCYCYSGIENTSNCLRTCLFSGENVCQVNLQVCIAPPNKCRSPRIWPTLKRHRPKLTKKNILKNKLSARIRFVQKSLPKFILPSKICERRSRRSRFSQCLNKTCKNINILLHMTASTINWFVQQICTLSLANLQICWTENQGVNLSHM